MRRLLIVFVVSLLAVPAMAQVSLRDDTTDQSTITVAELSQLVVEMFIYPPGQAPVLSDEDAFSLLRSRDLGSYEWSLDDIVTQEMLAILARQVGADYQAGDPDAAVSMDYTVKVLKNHDAEFRKYVSAYSPEHGSGADAFGELFEDAPSGAVSAIDF